MNGLRRNLESEPLFENVDLHRGVTPNEYGGVPAGAPDKAEPSDFDMVSKSIIDLAQQMGV
jgi:hypothetical protein